MVGIALKDPIKFQMEIILKPIMLRLHTSKEEACDSFSYVVAEESDC